MVSVAELDGKRPSDVQMASSSSQLVVTCKVMIMSSSFRRLNAHGPL